MTLAHTGGYEETRGVKQASFIMGDVRWEVIEPLDAESPVGRTLERRGEGIDHVALVVDNLAQTVQELQAKGVQLIGADQPGASVRVHPRSAHGVLIQLIERHAG